MTQVGCFAFVFPPYLIVFVCAFVCGRSLKGRRNKKDKNKGSGMGTLDEDNDEEETGGITIKASHSKSGKDNTAVDKED